MIRRNINKPPKRTHVPSRIRFTCHESGSVQLEAAAESEDAATGLRRFSMTAYTGGAMRLAGWQYPVVVDLAGLRVPKKARPILKDHDHGQIVGHTEEIGVGDRSLVVDGVVSGVGTVAQEIITTSENGFPWQASLGAAADRVVFIAEGKTAQANGRQFSGPVYIVRKSTLGEVSFVALGADDNTSAQVAAGSEADQNLEISSLDFEQWASDSGFCLDQMDESNVTSLQSVFETQQAIAAEANQTDEIAATKKAEGSPCPNPVDQMRSEVAAESRRIAAIRKICRGEHTEIEATAIEQGWDDTKTELAVLRASRPAAPTIITTRNETPSADVLEAAVCMAGKLPGIERQFTDQVLQSAQDRFQGRIGLQELLLEAAWANGYNGRSFKSNMRSVLEAAFSTFSLPGILTNTANKFLLQAFNAVESNWRAIAAIRPVTDFKQVTSYRLVADLMYEEVGADGELKHGKVSEEEFKNQAKTYGKLLSITRTDLVNDDLGALTAVPSQLGRGAGLKLNDIFWRAFLDNAAFFSAANKNYVEGAETSLGIDGMTKAEQLFLDQTGPDGHPLAIMPEILLVPNALYTIAQQLMNATEIREYGSAASRKYPTNNPHAGKFRVHRSSYLSNALYTGHSTKAWYLLADPANLPVIEVAFLDGQESPTVETADADFKNLGIQLRGFHDFGVNKQQHRGGIRMKGE